MKRIYRRILALALTVALGFTLIACNTNESDTFKVGIIQMLGRRPCLNRRCAWNG